jgi:hypothetical protein
VRDLQRLQHDDSSLRTPLEFGATLANSVTRKVVSNPLHCFLASPLYQPGLGIATGMPGFEIFTVEHCLDLCGMIQLPFV